MKAHARRLQWGLLPIFAIGFAVSTCAHARESGKESELEAEARQAAEEEAKEKLERDRLESDKRLQPTFQSEFTGTFRRLSESQASELANPQVIGTFVTALTDPKPGRRYLVKVEDRLQIKALQPFEGKPVKLSGKLRNIGPNGEAKYLIVTGILTQSQTPPPVRRRALGGI